MSSHESKLEYLKKTPDSQFTILNNWANRYAAAVLQKFAPSFTDTPLTVPCNSSSMLF